MVPLYLVGALAWVLIFLRGAFLLSQKTNASKFWKSWDEPENIEWLESKEKQWLWKLTLGVLNKKSESLDSREHWLSENFQSLNVLLYKNLKTISALAAAAPLIGLLGTVTGMRATFDVITKFGFGNAAMLADGISESLLTTQSGLVIAFPIVLAHNVLKNRALKIEATLEAHCHRLNRKVDGRENS